MAGLSVLAHTHTPPGIRSSSRGHSFHFAILTQRRLFFSSRTCFGISPHTENWESGLTLMMLLCVYFSSCCGFACVTSPLRGLFFFPHAAKKPLLVSPQILGCCGFLLSRFGHDMAKNDSGIEFPSQICVLTKLSPWFCFVVFSFLP